MLAEKITRVKISDCFPSKIFYDDPIMEFEKISSDVQIDNGILTIPKSIFQSLAKKSFTEMRTFFRAEHLGHWAEILNSPESSDSEKEKMHRNLLAAIESKKHGIPYCQDTGTDVVYIFRGDKTILTGEKSLEEEIGAGAIKARRSNPYRNSVFVPDETGETNSGDNSPAEIHYFHHDQPDEIRGIFCNKGGGSGSKLWNFSMPPSLYQDKDRLVQFLCQKLAEIGHSACPPYQLRIVLGGMSLLDNAQILTRSTVDDFSFLNKKVIQEKSIETIINQRLKDSEMGAQGEGSFFAMPDGLRVIRAPRHAAHFFIGIGVACSAHRVQSFKINKDGVFLEKLCKTPETFLEKTNYNIAEEDKIEINLSEDRETVLKQLRTIKSGKNFYISGKILGARDKAHSRWLQDYKDTGEIPEYLRKFLAVFYVGPADTPEGDIIGSFGPTTATRMDEFAEFLGENNCIPLSVAKGSRSKPFAANCGKYGLMFAATQGGPASLLRKHVKSVEILDFEEFGMEAVRLYEIDKIPVQMVVDSDGEDFYERLSQTFLRVV